MSIEHISIPECPICKDGHRYKLEVKRSITLQMLTYNNVNSKTKRVRFPRLFTCPTKNEDYQAIITLEETPSDRIENVQVLGFDDE